MVKTLKGKMSFVYLSLVLVIAFVGSVSVINLYRLNRAINGLMTDNYKSISTTGSMLEALERQDSAILIYINGDRQKGIDLFDENSNIFLKWYNIESNNITEPGENELVEKINGYYMQYIKSFSELQEMSSGDSSDKVKDYYNNKIMPDFVNLKAEMQQLSLLNEKAMFKNRDMTMHSTQQSMYIILILSGIAVIGGYILSRFFINKFLSPIYSLTEAVRLVKAGDLNKQTNIDSKDEVGELAAEFNDMTKRLQQYEQSAVGKLMDEKNRSLAIVKSISDPFIVLDTDFKIVLLNNACERFFNIHEEKVIGKHFLEAVRNDELFRHISSALYSKEGYKEKIIYISSEEDYYFNVVVTVIKDAAGNITGIIAAFQDVTQLKKLERVKTDFMATISHEFKTPLASVIMGTSLMLDENMGALNEDQRNVMNTIKEDEIRLSSLVNELLELSKIESDRAIFNIGPCSIEGIIETSIKQFYEQAQQKDINLYYELDDNLPKINADFEKITWVINNLIANALKYTNAGDEIIVHGYVKEHMMYVSVKDTGAGIPPEFQEKIFNKFVQVKGYDMEMRGTGLGLFIVKEIVDAHHGSIWCESELDAGSIFTFTIPLYKEETN